MGYDQYTVPDTVAVEPTFVAFLNRKHTSMARQISLKNSQNSKLPTIPVSYTHLTLPTNREV